MRYVRAESKELKSITGNVSISRTTFPRSTLFHVHNMQHAHKCGQTQKVRIRFHEHPLDFIQLRPRRRPLLLRRLGETLRKGGEDGELPHRHRLELDMQWEDRGRRVDLDILRTEMPELVGEDDRVVVRPASIIMLRPKVNVCKWCNEILSFAFHERTVTLRGSRLDLVQLDGRLIRNERKRKILNIPACQLFALSPLLTCAIPDASERQ